MTKTALTLLVAFVIASFVIASPVIAEEKEGWYWQNSCYDETGVVEPWKTIAPVEETQITHNYVIVWQGQTGFPFTREYVRLVEQGEGDILHPERWSGCSDRCGHVTYCWREAVTRYDKDAIYDAAIRDMYKQLHGKTPQDTILQFAK